MLLRTTSIIFILNLLLATVSIAQELYIFKENGKVGYMDSSGVIVIDSQYDAASQFTEGLAVVYLNHTASVIDVKNQQIVPPKYDNIKPFKDGYAVVRQNERYGLIDSTGKVVLKPIYDWISFQGEKRIGLKKDELWSFYSLEKREILSNTKYQLIGEFREGIAKVQNTTDGKYGFINLQGKLVVPFIFRFSYDFNDGFAAVIDSNGRNCYVDKNGKNLFGKTFDSNYSFSEGRAFVKDKFNSEGYFINIAGEKVSDQTYESAWFYKEGICGVKKDSTFLVIDKDENVLFSSSTIELRFFDCELGFFCDHSHKDLTWGVMNKDFQQITDLRFTKFPDDREASRVELYYGDPKLFYGYGQRGYINSKGNIIWEDRSFEINK